jgi:NAD(P)-dependent dehydrogenase (short-subunit alcohol dehydrogenase family)
MTTITKQVQERITMAGRFQDKIAVVTGGSSGIGLATADRLASEGALVFITGRRQEELDKAVSKISGRVIPIRADVANLDDLDRLYETVMVSGGPIDILVANAGVLERGVIGEITEESVDRMLSINVKGTIFTVQKALPLLVDGASIVLLSSTVASKGLGNNSVYAATKAAIRSFARTWITDLKDRKIRVNAISPGPVATPGLAGATPEGVSPEALMSAFAAQIPLGRPGRAEEIAAVVAFLASEDGSLISGADIQADGGWAQI